MTLRMLVVVALASGCTAGGVAVQGQGFLIPAVGYTVSYMSLATCQRFEATTASTGTFSLNGHKYADRYVPPGMVCVSVRSPDSSLNKVYKFDHQFDTTCPNEKGEQVSCSKDLFILSSTYDELSANAPGPEVHVRLPGPSNICQQNYLICN